LNRIYLGVLMYGPVTPRFYMKYQGYVSQIAQAMPGVRPSILTSNAPYVEMATSNLILAALRDKDWDYLVFLEHDNIAPDDWANVVANELDPDVHKIVGRWYFGKVQEDMRSIPGYVYPNGTFDRFSFNEVKFFHDNPGLYRVGAGMEGVNDGAATFTVGVGCTAVHRSVFENWTGEMPWFNSVMDWVETPDDPAGNRGMVTMLGHDVNFCREASKQGFHVWVDTRRAAGHIGEFVSDETTYMATAQFMLGEGTTSLSVLAGKPDPDNLQPGIPTGLSQKELMSLSKLAVDKTVLEIGSRYGASTIGMAGMGAKIVYALDWHRGDQWHGEPDGTGDSLEVFWRYIGNYGQRDKIVPLVGKSDQLLPILPAQYFDLILVDGDHSYEGVKYDLHHAKRLLKPGGIIAVHDWKREEEFPYPEESGLAFGITQACRELLGEPDELIDTVAIYHDPARRTIAV
jgi:predicted O-methyltransferase YrrM